MVVKTFSLKHQIKRQINIRLYLISFFPMAQFSWVSLWCFFLWRKLDILCDISQRYILAIQPVHKYNLCKFVALFCNKDLLPCYCENLFGQLVFEIRKISNINYKEISYIHFQSNIVTAETISTKFFVTYPYQQFFIQHE